MSNLEERRTKMLEKNNIRKANREKVSKNFRFESSAEKAEFKIIQECNSIQFTTFRKGVTQVRGKEVSFGLNKKEVQELKDYLTQALDNWDEWNSLDK